jgi:hypothetical protein
MDRQQLRAITADNQLRTNHRGRHALQCPWCLEPVNEYGDLHEALVKRSAVPPDQQHLIMVHYNTVILHHGCHMGAGQTQEMKRRCLWALCKSRSAKAVGEWYVSLWRDHELSVRKGNLQAPELHDAEEGFWFQYLLETFGFNNEWPWD